MTSTIYNNVSKKRAGYFVDALRILTGAILAAGGVQYMLAQSSAMRVLEQIGFDIISSTVLIPIITIVELVGGILLVFGLLTRMAAAIQIPLIILFLVGHELRTDVSGISYPMWFDVLILIAIIICIVYGSGRVSIDRFLRQKQHEVMSAYQSDAAS